MTILTRKHDTQTETIQTRKHNSKKQNITSRRFTMNWHQKQNGLVFLHNGTKRWKMCDTIKCNVNAACVSADVHVLSATGRIAAHTVLPSTAASSVGNHIFTVHFGRHESVAHKSFVPCEPNCLHRRSYVPFWARLLCVDNEIKVVRHKTIARKCSYLLCATTKRTHAHYFAYEQ